MNLKWIICTDLDGSLLDHDTYSYEQAKHVMDLMVERDIPLIPCSSKTSAEIRQFRYDSHNNHPYIVENGAAVYIPEDYFSEQPENTQLIGGYWVKEFSKSRKYWQKLIEQLSPSYGTDFITFADAGAKGIIEMTGLDAKSAELAAERYYGEPISWHGSENSKQAFIEEIQQLGAQVLQGGRFIHISDHCDKGKAVVWLKNLYQKQQPQFMIKALAIGDSYNDIAMLEQADNALIIRSALNPPPLLKRQGNKLISTYFGPKGWAEGVLKIITESTQVSSHYKGRNKHD